MATYDIAVGWTTVASLTEAESLAKKILEERLAACVQVDAGVKSFYPWDGKLCAENEVRLWVKTTRSLAEEIALFLDEHHPYDTPQWVWIPADGSDAYGQWIQGEVRSNGGA
ncbi:MAG: divalent-cation tolerance protein CutA [Puniceicoccales bacterium]